MQEFPVVNLLVVVARPNKDEDVGYRTISRLLREAIEKSRLRVRVHLLRPGTYEALERHWEEKGAGFCHFVHFDVHGALLTYEISRRGAEARRGGEGGRSLGSHLMTAGMEMVVGMAYSVTVTAATLMITKLYTDLFAAKTITEPLRLNPVTP